MERTADVLEKILNEDDRSEAAGLPVGPGHANALACPTLQVWTACVQGGRIDEISFRIRFWALLCELPPEYDSINSMVEIIMIAATKTPTTTAAAATEQPSLPSGLTIPPDEQKDGDVPAPCCSPSVESGACTEPGLSLHLESPSLSEAEAEEGSSPKISFFAKYLTLWVALAMIIGTTIGALVPSIPEALEKATIASIWIPGSILVWLMVYPMMLQVRWSAIRYVHQNPGGLFLTTFINWAIQPFLMFAFAKLFFYVVYDGILTAEKQSEYIAGAVILGGSPCTAMVFVWSNLVGGDPNYTLVQVVLNDMILLFLYVPTAKLLLNLSDVELPWDTVYLSVVLFVVVPFAFGVLTQFLVLRRPHGEEVLKQIGDAFSPVASFSLVLLVVFIFISQAKIITDSPQDVLLVAVPLILQTVSIFVLTYGMAYYICLPYNVGGPASFIGSSNFFELAVALALTVYGPKSGAVLVTVVGVLTEVPNMLMEVYFVKATKEAYKRRVPDVSTITTPNQDGCP